MKNIINNIINNIHTTKIYTSNGIISIACIEGAQLVTYHHTPYIISTQLEQLNPQATVFLYGTLFDWCDNETQIKAALKQSNIDTNLENIELISKCVSQVHQHANPTPVSTKETQDPCPPPIAPPISYKYIIRNPLYGRKSYYIRLSSWADRPEHAQQFNSLQDAINAKRVLNNDKLIIQIIRYPVSTKETQDPYKSLLEQLLQQTDMEALIELVDLMNTPTEAIINQLIQDVQELQNQLKTLVL